MGYICQPARFVRGIATEVVISYKVKVTYFSWLWLIERARGASILTTLWEHVTRMMVNMRINSPVTNYRNWKIAILTDYVYISDGTFGMYWGGYKLSNESEHHGSHYISDISLSHDVTEAYIPLNNTRQ